MTPRSPDVGSLAGRAVLVTGSTAGIGLAIAKALASLGADVMLNGVDPPGVALEALRGAVGRIEHFAADLASPDQVTAMAEAALETFGRVDILVNNFGVHSRGDVQDIPPEDWTRTLAINLTAPYLAVRAVLPQMLARNWGRVINIASTYGLVGTAGYGAYVASKHGLLGLTKAIALENCMTGVTCNAICPGWTRTERTDGEVQAFADERMIDLDEAKRLMHRKEGTPSETFIAMDRIAETVAFLCGPSGEQIRGAAIPIDDGFAAR